MFKNDIKNMKKTGTGNFLNEFSHFCTAIKFRIKIHIATNWL